MNKFITAAAAALALGGAVAGFAQPAAAQHGGGGRGFGDHGRLITTAPAFAYGFGLGWPFYGYYGVPLLRIRRRL